jgi:RNA polymerase sigma factor (sigma-70 family)
VIERALTLLSDERLAQLAAAGSDPAFATLYNRYSGTLFAYCRSITRNADDGWDALQNAMIKVLMALRRSPERGAPIRPWLFCICHNESIGVLRRRAAADRVAGAAIFTVARGADDEALEREVVQEVVSDVQQLPTGQRAALVMRELADLRYDEIAVALETTEGNARQLVFAARAGLRDSRAGRGLPCESVRDQLSLADGRLLRRRSVRAHLRTCDGCREYATSMRRPQPAAALSAWTPFGAYELLAGVLRAVPAGSGGSLFGPIAVKAAAVTAVLATGIGAADVATTRSGASSQAANHVVARAAPVVRERSTAAMNATPRTARVISAALPSRDRASLHTAVAVEPVATHTVAVAAGPGSARHEIAATTPDRRPHTSQPDDPQPPHHAQPQQPQHSEPRESRSRPQAADCNTQQATREAAPEQRPAQQDAQPATQDVAFDRRRESRVR